MRMRNSIVGEDKSIQEVKKKTGQSMRSRNMMPAQNTDRNNSPYRIRIPILIDGSDWICFSFSHCNSACERKNSRIKGGVGRVF